MYLLSVGWSKEGLKRLTQLRIAWKNGMGDERNHSELKERREKRGRGTGI